MSVTPPGTTPPFDPEGHIWDVVVIGTGAGGATAGFAIALKGKSVLFLERGKALDHDPAVTRGQPFAWDGGSESALNHGWWPEPLIRKYGPHQVAGHQPIGAGTGGSTAVFGMVMDRLRPADFTPRESFPAAADSSLPDAWPIGYDELAPYYDRAEQQYRVRGTLDPLGPPRTALLPPPQATPRESAVSTALSECGLHPYRIPYAQDRVAGCQGCAAMLCPRECRNDAARMCLRPAVQQHGAQLLTGCRVVRLEEAGRAVRSAACDWQGKRLTIRARIFVLAANAFMTPDLLQRSSNARFPDGLANSSGMVGRNLMLHASDFLLVRSRRNPRGLAPAMNHGLSLNDFYTHEGVKLGNIHVHPVPVTREMTLAFMRMHMKRVNRLPRPLLSAAAAAGALLHRSSLAFSTVLEDLPYTCNRVLARKDGEAGVAYDYRHPHELRERSWKLFLAFKAAIAPRFTVRPLRPVGMLNMSHVCGTCRFGDDPRTSVLDRNNRAHDLDNLYVADASFFPSSGGINPSLTIAANSLRVGDAIASRL
jgi:choline dehydrogenase-like flavoprotein